MIRSLANRYLARKEARHPMKRLLITAFFVAAIVSFASAQDMTGDWQGPLTTPVGELRLIIHVTKAADGTLKAVMDSPDQAMAGAPLDVFTFEGGKVHFTLNVAKGVFDGSLKGSTINGYWSQGGGPKMQLVLNKTTTPLKTTHDPAPPSDIDGTWDGIYNTPTGGTTAPEKNRVTFYIKNRLLEQSLGLYLSPKQVRRILKEPGLRQPGGSKQVVSILFSDVDGFSRISEQLDPAELVQLLNTYYETTIRAIHETEGTIMDIIGDAIFAVWNSPEPQPALRIDNPFSPSR